MLWYSDRGLCPPAHNRIAAHNLLCYPAGMMHPNAIALLLSEANLPQLIAELRPWLDTASYADIRHLVEQCHGAYRQHLVLLLRDLMTKYPHGVYGIPVLFYYRGTRPMTLPLPEHSPDPDVLSLEWLSLDSLWRPVPFKPSPAGVLLRPGRVSCAVLVATTHTAAPPDLASAHDWWGELFAVPDGESIWLSARITLPYPDAVEAGQALLDAATGNQDAAAPGLFVDDRAFAWSAAAGLEARRALDELKLPS